MNMFFMRQVNIDMVEYILYYPGVMLLYTYNWITESQKAFRSRIGVKIKINIK